MKAQKQNENLPACAETEQGAAPVWTPGQPDTCTISAHGFRLKAYRAGHGPAALLLLHGAGLDSAMLSWREVLAQFGAQWGAALTAYAIDMPGYGESTRPGPAPGDSFYPEIIETVFAAARALGLSRFALAGLSMGGSIAIGLALKHPEAVTALIPTDSWGLAHSVPCHRLCWWYIHNTHWTKASFAWYGKNRNRVKWVIGAALIGDKAKITEAMVDEVWQACRQPDAGQSMEDFQRSSILKTGVVPDYGAALAKLSMPVLFLNGEKDDAVPLRLTQKAAALVPGAQVEVLPGCRHWPPKEQPERFCALVAEFVQKAECLSQKA
jgi:pimeloyl-ACP methyl ester carboxylesterase